MSIPIAIKFDTLNIGSSTHQKDQFGRHVLNVSDPHALIQAVGYLKHMCSYNGESIYFRGQSSSYERLSPSLFRLITRSQKSRSDHSRAMDATVKRIVRSNDIFDSFDSIAHEPLLQHYGLKTTWVDLIDNIWVALWFACHQVFSSGRYGWKYIHFQRRDAYNEPDAMAYVLCVATEFSPTKVAGHHQGNSTELIDLRICAPSVFLRPHAQHGLLFRMRPTDTGRPLDYASCIRGIVGIKLRDALNWLGDAPTLSVHGLFPPPYYDTGYGQLLNSHSDVAYSDNTSDLDRFDVGSISLIGA